MPQVDFYVLSTHTPESRLAFAAKLCEKALHANLQVRVLTQNDEISNALSQALWAGRPESFIPHLIAGAATPAPIVITHQPEHCLPAPDQSLLINLSNDLPEAHTNYARVAEIVIQIPQVLEQTRGRYAHYKQSSHPINTHKIGQK